MQPNEFIHWLSGFLATRTELNDFETEIVSNMLQSVFLKVTPNQFPKPPKATASFEKIMTGKGTFQPVPSPKSNHSDPVEDKSWQYLKVC